MVYILSLLTALYIGLSGCATYKFQNLTPEAAEIQREYFSGSTHIFTQMMSETPHQTPLFHFRGEQSGPRVLIIGGTHGNEPAGFEAAHRLVRKFTDTPLVKGEVFLIPEANKVADRVVQIFGGRGYMREFAAERFYRELRVDRIWEGTSEVQRLKQWGR